MVFAGRLARIAITASMLQSWPRQQDRPANTGSFSTSGNVAAGSNRRSTGASERQVASSFARSAGLVSGCQPVREQRHDHREPVPLHPGHGVGERFRRRQQIGLHRQADEGEAGAFQLLQRGIAEIGAQRRRIAARRETEPVVMLMPRRSTAGWLARGGQQHQREHSGQEAVTNRWHHAAIDRRDANVR